MTHRERFIKTLKCEPIGGQVPTFELVFFLTMEAFGKVHPSHRYYDQWEQMSYREKKLHIEDAADIYIRTAQRYDHSAIFIHPNPGGFENVQWLLETIREKTGDEYFIMMHGDVTHSMPDGSNLMDFCVDMLENPEKINDQSKRWVEEHLEMAQKLDAKGHLLDGFAMCSDYCFNTNPFFRPDQFDEFIVPYLKQAIDEYRKMGYYSIKHTDGNVMPILKQIADCKPDAIHSLDPQGGVSIPEVRKIVGDDICLIGNVNCGLLQTGTDEEMRADVMRSLNQGMANGRGYIFSTSNCAYTGLPLERYETMIDIWREYGNYDK
jgi:uroporphyrinogen decarboxylase